MFITVYTEEWKLVIGVCSGVGAVMFLSIVVLIAGLLVYWKRWRRRNIHSAIETDGLSGTQHTNESQDTNERQWLLHPERLSKFI